MKKKILTLALAALTLTTTGCSEDYLDTTPTSSVSEAQIFADTYGVKMAVNGLSLLMKRQYGYSSREQTLNGEGTVYMFHGEFAGTDYQKAFWTGWAPLANCTWVDRNAQVQNTFPWIYAYRVISNANNILAQVDKVSGTDKEKAFLKAQALTFRAYFYNMLAQIYSRRWTDANGQQRGVILRLEPTTDPMPCSYLYEVMDQIYADLDEAISLFTSSGMDREAGEFWLPNINVAHGVYARAALVRNDWQKAYDHAKLARAGYPLMTAAEYASGFNYPNKEWIWGVYDDDQETIYYHSFHAYNASNSAGSSMRSYPPCISKELFVQIPEGDVRRELYAYPLPEEEGQWNTKDSNSGEITKKSAYLARIQKKFGSKITSTTKYCAYLATKFQTRGSANGGCLSIMRGAEMLYNQAEAAFRLGKEAEVRSLIEEAVAPYQADYKCTKSGADLWTELKLYRRFDLWGEGFNWFDLKRWGEDHIRKTWSEGGSFALGFCGSGEDGGTGGNFKASTPNRWVYVIPRKETDYNKLVTTYEAIAANGEWDYSKVEDTEE